MKHNHSLISLCKAYLNNESLYQAVLDWYKTDYEIDLEDEDLPGFIRAQGFCEIIKRLYLLASKIRKFDGAVFAINSFNIGKSQPNSSLTWLIVELASFIRLTSVKDLREANLWSEDIEQEIVTLSK